jgi:hypothetical protein
LLHTVQRGCRRVPATSITVKYKRAEVPETLEVDVKPGIQIPAGEGCDPVEYHFGVVVP